MYNEVDQDPGRPRHQDRALAGRLLHHLAGDGGLLDHAAQARRRADRAVGRAGQHAGPALGSLRRRDAVLTRQALSRRWVRGVRRGWSRRTGTYLTELDSAIGDADHGTNMDRGMQAVLGQAGRESRPATSARCCKTVGMTLVSTVGGASGPLYGTFFLQMGDVAAGKSELDRPRWPPRCGPGSTASARAARPSPATRRCSTPWRRRCDALEAALAERRALADALRRSAEAAEAGMTRRSRCWPARAAPATSASAARVTRTRAPRRPAAPAGSSRDARQRDS